MSLGCNSSCADESPGSLGARPFPPLPACGGTGPAACEGHGGGQVPTALTRKSPKSLDEMPWWAQGARGRAQHPHVCPVGRSGALAPLGQHQARPVWKGRDPWPVARKGPEQGRKGSRSERCWPQAPSCPKPVGPSALAGGGSGGMRPGDGAATGSAAEAGGPGQCPRCRGSRGSWLCSLP